MDEATYDIDEIIYGETVAALPETFSYLAACGDLSREPTESELRLVALELREQMRRGEYGESQGELVRLLCAVSNIKATDVAKL